MSGTLLYGADVAGPLLEKIEKSAAKYSKQHYRLPGLAIVLVGDNPSSEAYVNIKLKRCTLVGINAKAFRFPENTSESELMHVIQDLNNNLEVNGIIIQLPLPSHLNSTKLINAISPSKDVDGLTFHNIGKLHGNQYDIAPCTPKGIVYLLKTLPIELSGKHVAVIGRSQIVGRPLSALLLHENCTVTQIHSHSKNWKQLTQMADIVVVAAGTPGLLQANHIKENAIVIDVGSTKVKLKNGQSKFAGDCHQNILEKAKYLTPVPGGVGPMTVAMLLSNTVDAAWRQEDER